MRRTEQVTKVGGFAIHDGSLVWGFGLTEQEAWDDAYVWAVEMHEPVDDDHRAALEVELERMTCSPASVAAIDAQDGQACVCEDGIIVHVSEIGG